MKLAAAYVRVSTEEQVIRGYSIEAQRDALWAYAKANGYQIVQEYSDEGVSGKKPYNKRPALSRFMDDLRSGRIRVDVLLFCKLDRFYRSVKLYYQAVELLDKYGVAWKAILEDYETETANGRLKVNMMLAIAENEADRTGERIKFVFESRVAKGQVITGKLPLGLMVRDHKVVHNPEEVEAARALFYEYERLHSVAGAIRVLEEKFGVVRSVSWAKDELRNTLYKGQYRDNTHYCEPLIPPEDFDRIQELMKSRCVRRNKKRTYIFSGLIVCASCGQKMTGMHSSRGTDYYRCHIHGRYPQRCSNRTHISEDALEKWLILNVGAELDAARARVQTEYEENERAIPDKAGVLRKLKRLKELYVADMIDMEDYRRDYESYQSELAEIERLERERPKTPDFDRLQKRINSLSDEYSGFTDEEKQTFWREIIQKMVADSQKNIQIYFL